MYKRQLRRFAVDGEDDVAFRQGTEQGLVWVEAPVAVQPGQQVVLEAAFTERPAPRPPLVRLEQPLVRDERFLATDCTTAP